MLALRDGFTARYAALPTDSTREAALGKLNQDLQAAIEAQDAAVEAQRAVASAAKAAVAALRPTLNGTWTGPGLKLVIDAGDSVHYEKHDGSVNTEVNAPINNLTATGFDVGMFGNATHFVLDTAPHNDGGVWKMKVDGVELTRKD